MTGRLALALAQLPNGERLEIVCDRRPYRVVLREGCLDEDLATQRTPSGPARDLAEELEGPLTRPEVR